MPLRGGDGVGAFVKVSFFRSDGHCVGFDDYVAGKVMNASIALLDVRFDLQVVRRDDLLCKG